MSKVTLKVEIDEEAYKQIKGDSVCSNNNECIISKSSSAYYALNAIINATTLTECDDTVSRGVFEQVMWERDTAIEQLRKLGYELGQKIEPCDDVVSRQAVNDLYDRYHPWLATRVYEFGEELKALPSVTPERKQGEWIEKVHNFEKCWAECSVCGKTASGRSKDTGWGYTYSYTDYCPNCGARMVEPQESEE